MLSVSGSMLNRHITEIVHFTTNRGLIGSLASGAVISRKALPKEELLEKVLYNNAAYRSETGPSFDKAEDWIDYVNLSISEINSRYYSVSKGWHAHSSVWWVIMSFDPGIAVHDGVYFATTNNAYEHCVRGKGYEGLEALFVDTIKRKGPNWRAFRLGRPANLPTCEQAEVLYPQRVATAYLRRVYVSSDEHFDIVRGWLNEFGLPTVEVVNQPVKFSGKPN